MKRIYTLLLFFHFTIVFAQHKTDSLWRVWHTASLPDTVRLAALEEITKIYMFTMPDSAKMLAQNIIDYAVDIAIYSGR